MLFSVSYHSTHLEEAGEIKCPYNQLRWLLDYMRKHKDTRYVVIYPGDDLENLVKQIDILKDIVSNYTVECQSLAELKTLINEGYSAYLKYHVCDWETVHQLIDFGVSDIYIDGPLGFQLKNVKKLCGNVKIRISPTVSPNAALSGIQPNSFFIRPDDLQYYEKYIDIIDFKVTKQEKEDALFDIYKRGRFYYNLKDILEGCQFSVLNPFIKPEFGQSRLNCNQRCLIPGHSCHLCDTQIQLTNLVYNYFKQKDQEQQDRHTLQI